MFKIEYALVAPYTTLKSNGLLPNVLTRPGLRVLYVL